MNDAALYSGKGPGHRERHIAQDIDRIQREIEETYRNQAPEFPGMPS